MSGPDATDVFSAWLCCSVGATWTVELRPVDKVRGVTGPAAPVVDWICTGVPTELPAPDAQLGDVLAERNLLLFAGRPDDTASRMAQPRTRSRSRRLIGYVTRSPEVMRLALTLTDLIDEPPDPRETPHPLLLAAQWIDAGYSADAAAGWATAGITSPAAAQRLLSSELDRSTPLRVVPRQLAHATRWGDPS